MIISGVEPSRRVFIISLNAIPVTMEVTMGGKVSKITTAETDRLDRQKKFVLVFLVKNIDDFMAFGGRLTTFYG